MQSKLLFRSVVIGGLIGSFFAVQAYAGDDDYSGQIHRHWMERHATLFDAHLAGLKAALKLNSDQEKTWTTFESAVRTIDERREDRFRETRERGSSDERPSPIDRLQALSARLERRSSELKAIASAASPMYASLDDNQKQDFTLLFSEVFRNKRKAYHRS